MIFCGGLQKDFGLVCGEAALYLHPTRVVRVVIVEEPRAALSCSQQEDTNSKIQGGYVNGQIVRENIHLQSSH